MPTDSTLKAYAGRIRAVKHHIITHLKLSSSEPDKITDVDINDYELFLTSLRILDLNKETAKGYLSALLFETKDKNADAYTAYHKYFLKLKNECIETAKNQELPPNRAENLLKWDEVVKATDKARLIFEADKSKDNYYRYLVMALYTYQAPVRADYTGMCISSDTTTTEQFLVINPNRNFIKLGYDSSTFCFNTYKTAKTYGRRIIDCDSRIVSLVSDYGRAVFKNWYFLLPEEWTPNYLSEYVAKCFLDMSGKKCGIGLLRHAYICYFYELNPSIRQKEELARRMLHSVRIQELYRTVKVVKGEATPSIITESDEDKNLSD